MNEVLENSFVLRLGDTLDVKINLEMDGIVVPFPVYKVLLTRTTENECKADLFALKSDIDTSLYNSIVQGVRDSVNQQLVALAEKKGGFLSAKEMSDYLLKQDFIRELKRK